MDLNLARTFVLVFQHQSFTKAAEILGVSQPAVSKAIRKLESDVGDALFVKSGRGISPTSRAVSLATDFQRAIDIIDNAVFSKNRLSVYCVEALMHSLGDIDAATFKVPPLDQELLFDQLRAQQIDLVIDTTTTKDTAFEIECIHTEPIAVICRKDHPEICGDSLNKEQYFQLDHIEYKATRDGRSFLEIFAEEPLAHRNIVRQASNQATMAMLAAKSDCIGLVFESFAREWAGMLNLKVLPMPVECRDVPIHMIYHKRRIQDPQHQMIRELIKQRIHNI